MTVVIVGAGIGGLVTALRLHHEGLDCEVYEQSEQIRELGVGLNALPNAVKELAVLGLLDWLEELGVRTSELFYTHRLGHEILRRPCGMQAGFSYPQLSIHRGQLQGVLLRAVRERLGPDAVRTGHRLVGFEQDARGVRADFVGRRGEALDPAHGAVLAAADGIHSTVRSLLFPEEGPPCWNGVMMWRGATDWPEFGTGRSMIIAGGTAAKLVIYPIGQGRDPGTMLTNWAVCIGTGRPGDPPPQRQDWSRRADPAGLEPHVGRFRTPLLDHAELITATRECFEFPMCDRNPLPYWTQGRVTLLGDAAHPMYPMGSNGAGQAILDATSLSGHLARHADPADALQAYQYDRLPATGEVVLRNRKGGPESVIDEVERRAPEGFSRLEDVIDSATLEAIVNSYAHASGSSPEQVTRVDPNNIPQPIRKTHRGDVMGERSGPFWDGVEGRAPIPRAAATLGWEFIDADVEKGTIEVAFKATEDFTNPAGNVLGAFLAAMLYDTVGPALLATLKPGQFQSTLQFSVNFLRPVRPGRIVGKGRVVHRNGDLAYLSATLNGSGKTIIATASATARVIDLDQAPLAP